MSINFLGNTDCSSCVVLGVAGQLRKIRSMSAEDVCLGK